MTSLKSHLDRVFDRIHAAEKNCNRDGQVTLLAVSKTKPAEIVQEAYELGLRDFGENYLQEALSKIHALGNLNDISWHFIGPIQSNKTRDIANHFQWVHSVDRLKIAKRLSDQRSDELPPLNICLQVNISDEESKSGVTLSELPNLVAEISLLPKLKLRGLMAIPAPESDETLQRAPFKKLCETLNKLNDDQGLSLDTLSIGMTGDLEAAITEGSTLVRIGTALFGNRNYT